MYTESPASQSGLRRLGDWIGENAAIPREYRERLSLRCGHSACGLRLSPGNLQAWFGKFPFWRISRRRLGEVGTGCHPCQS
jgi:hypothetical protein